VQTFLPFPDLRVSCQVLDDRRLGKQRVETFQVLRALTWPEYAWKNHPAVRMWRGFVPALVEYGLESCHEWTRRGHADSLAPQLLEWTGGRAPTGAPLPPWFGLAALHRSHRSSLLRKEPAFYRPLFDALGHAGEPDDLPYLWPADVFPRWPVRGGTDGRAPDDAARLLGLPAPRPWQADAAEAVTAGRDVLLIARPGAGGSTAGLLAGLVRPGRTLVVRPWDGPVAAPAPSVPLRARTGTTAVAGGGGPPLARPAGPVERAAMADEQQPPEFVFAHPDRLPGIDELPGVTLVVVDRAAELTPPEWTAVAGLREALGAPLLAVTGRADDVERRRLAALAGLHRPVHLGGGWDPAGTHLARRHAATASARRRLLEAAVRDGRPALVVTADRGRADRLVTGLAAAGLRAAVWAPPPLRTSRAAAAVAAWRSRRLDALVVPTGPLPPLGRVRPALLVGADEVVGDADSWRALVEETAAPRALLLADLEAPQLGGAGCLRADLLASFGEPVAVPCGRCDVCAEAGRPAVSGATAP
jgi:hypothetical protein